MSGSTHGPDTHLWDLLFQEARLRPHLLTRSAGWLMLTFSRTCTGRKVSRLHVGFLFSIVITRNICILGSLERSELSCSRCFHQGTPMEAVPRKKIAVAEKMSKRFCGSLKLHMKLNAHV